jgi:hypothetical protein
MTSSSYRTYLPLQVLLLNGEQIPGVRHRF